VRLQHFLQIHWDEISQLTNEEGRRTVFANVGALYTTRQQRSIIEAVIRGELTNKDVAAYIIGEDTLKVKAVLDKHQGYIYGGKKPIPRALKARVHARDGGKCLACGDVNSLDCDHYPIPESQGGLAKLSNLRTLCRSCNGINGTKSLTICQIRQRRALMAAHTCSTQPLIQP
jgi:hypothetical protein